MKMALILLLTLTACTKKPCVPVVVKEIGDCDPATKICQVMLDSGWTASLYQPIAGAKYCTSDLNPVSRGVTTGVSSSPSPSN